MASADFQRRKAHVRETWKRAMAARRPHEGDAVLTWLEAEGAFGWLTADTWAKQFAKLVAAWYVVAPGHDVREVRGAPGARVLVFTTAATGADARVCTLATVMTGAPVPGGVTFVFPPASAALAEAAANTCGGPPRVWLFEPGAAQLATVPFAGPPTTAAYAALVGCPADRVGTMDLRDSTPVSFKVVYDSEPPEGAPHNAAAVAVLGHTGLPGCRTFKGRVAVVTLAFEETRAPPIVLNHAAHAALPPAEAERYVARWADSVRSLVQGVTVDAAAYRERYFGLPAYVGAATAEDGGLATVHAEAGAGAGTRPRQGAEAAGAGAGAGAGAETGAPGVVVQQLGDLPVGEHACAAAGCAVAASARLLCPHPAGGWYCSAACHRFACGLHGGPDAAFAAMCARAGCHNAAPLVCARCKATAYCGAVCQAAAWREGHRGECRKAPT